MTSRINYESFGWLVFLFIMLYIYIDVETVYYQLGTSLYDVDETMFIFMFISIFFALVMMRLSSIHHKVESVQKRIGPEQSTTSPRTKKIAKLITVITALSVLIYFMYLMYNAGMFDFIFEMFESEIIEDSI